MKDQELLNVADFFVILFRGKLTFLACWVLVMAASLGYLSVAKKKYKLTGSLYVGRFQQVLLEEGEFVASKLQDYSFIKRALTAADVQLDIPVSRLTRLVTTEVINEVKKNEDVGLVKLTVEYKDPELTFKIFKALTDQLIKEHDVLLAQAAGNLKELSELFWKDEAVLREDIKAIDERLAEAAGKNRSLEKSAEFLMLAHTVAEQRGSHQRLLKDIYYLNVESDSATKSFNTRLASEPQMPDEHFKPKKALVLILGFILATVAATVGTLSLHFYNAEVKPRLHA